MSKVKNFLIYVKMKKLLATLTIVFSFATLLAFTVNRDVTLSNEKLGQSLFLYTNGKCVITNSNGGRGEGTYDLKVNGQIYIQWENGKNQQGTYKKDKYGMQSVYIEGYTYSTRRVIPRS